MKFLPVALMLFSSSLEGFSAQASNDYKDSINRIEYQIPMDRTTLSGDSNADVEANVQAFIQWAKDTLETEFTTDDGVASTTFEVDLTSIDPVYREKYEVDLDLAESQYGHVAPRASSFKYRTNYGDVDTMGYQKDLSWEIVLSTPGRDADWESITSIDTYADIFGTKVEANVFADPCTAINDAEGKDVQNRPYVDEPTGFTAKIEFDDDAAYDSFELDTSGWGSDAMKTLCTDMEHYFTDACDYYKGGFNDYMSQSLRNNIQYVVDVDFYLKGTGSNTACKGKFTWQVRYNNDNALQNGNVSRKSTELSLKLKKSKCSAENEEVGETIDWDTNVALGEKIVDYISANAQWIDSSSCA